MLYVHLLSVAGSTELKDLAPAFRTIMEKFPKLSRVLSPTEQRHLVCMLKDKVKLTL